MKRSISVIFKPEGRKVRTASGTSIFEAACKADVGISARAHADAMFIPHKDSCKFLSVKEYFRRFGRDV